jgi:hypothetical protein
MMALTTYRRTAGIVIIDLRRLISFYLARFIVWRTLASERKAARRNFKQLKKMQTAGERDTQWSRA